MVASFCFSAFDAGSRLTYVLSVAPFHVHELGSLCPISVDVTTRMDSREGGIGGRDRAEHQRHMHVYRLAKTIRCLQLFVLLSTAMSMAPMAEARLIGIGNRQLKQQQAIHNKFSSMAKKHEKNRREEVSAEFEAKYPSMADEIRRRRQEQLEAEREFESNASNRSEFPDIVDVVDMAQSRGLQSATQHLKVTPTNESTKPLVTLTLAKQSSSSEISNARAIKGLNHRGAQILDIEFLLDRPERQTQTKFHVQMNLVTLAMGRSDGLVITAEEEGHKVNGSVTGMDKFVVSEQNRAGDGDGDGVAKDDGLHLMAVAPATKPPASLDSLLLDETILPP